MIGFSRRDVKCVHLLLHLSLVIIVPLVAMLALGLATSNLWKAVMVDRVFVLPVASLVFVVFLMRYAFVFPAASVDQYRGFKAARLLLSGSTWRLFWSSLLVALLPAAVFAILQLALAYSHQQFDLTLWATRPVSLFLSWLQSWLMVVLITTVWVLAYKRLTSPPGEAQEASSGPVRFQASPYHA